MNFDVQFGTLYKVPGKDGFSPLVELEKTDGVTTLTITDINGPKSVEILDGDKAETKLDKMQGIENTGKLLYVGADGNVTVLALGAGLEIVDGVLTITNAQVAAAICGQAICGETICGGS